MYENIRTIADSGIKMVDSYKNGTKKFVESMAEIFEWFHSKNTSRWRENNGSTCDYTCKKRFKKCKG